MRKSALDQKQENVFQRIALCFGKRLLQVLADIPFRKKIQLAPQQRLVVGRQLARARRELPAAQRVGSVGEELRRVLRVERLQVGGGAEIGEQQEARCEVLRQDLGRVHAGRAQQGGDVDERPAVLLVGRSVHDDVAAAVGEPRAPVAPEAGVLGSAFQGEAKRRLGDEGQVGKPALHGIAPRIGVYHGKF